MYIYIYVYTRASATHPHNKSICIDVYLHLCIYQGVSHTRQLTRAPVLAANTQGFCAKFCSVMPDICIFIYNMYMYILAKYALFVGLLRSTGFRAALCCLMLLRDLMFSQLDAPAT